MFARNVCRSLRGLSRSAGCVLNGGPGANYSSCPSNMKVTICGAAGATGQPLSLLLKQSPLLDEIALYDLVATCGYGMELGHVDTKCKISSYSGSCMLCDSLKDAKVVVILASSNTGDSFEKSAPIVSEIAIQICNTCPQAFTLVATEPVESMVPLVAEIQRVRGNYNPRRLLGVTELQGVRANTVVADFLGVPPETVTVPIIGGCSTDTMVPVLSGAVYPLVMSQEQIECVTSSILSGGDAVSCAKCCSEGACLAGAFAVARVVTNVVRGLVGEKDVKQCAYVDSQCCCAPCCQFLCNEVIIGPSGIEKNLGIPELSKFENCLLCNAIPLIRNEIARAEWLVYCMCQQPGTCCADCCSPCSCYTPAPPPPCCPPIRWTCDCPDACRDEYLSSICRDMTCYCAGTDLCWRPRDVNYEESGCGKTTHQLPLKGRQCGCQSLPRSLAFMKQNQDKPC